MHIPIDTTVINDEEDELKRLLIEQSQALSARLNQLRYKIRTSDREKLEIESISRQVEKITQELDALEQKHNKKK